MENKKISRKDFLKIFAGFGVSCLLSNFIFGNLFNKKQASGYGSTAYGGK